MSGKYTRIMPAMLVAIFISATALTAQEIDESGYVEVDTLELGRMTQEKLDACLRASGNDELCQCLADKLPVGLSFNGYIMSVTQSRQQLGYDAFTAIQQSLVDSAIGVRNQCVTDSDDISALIDRPSPTGTGAPPVPTASSLADKKDRMVNAPASVETTRLNASSNRSYLVQAASFKLQKDAEDLASLLSDNGMDARITEVSLPKRGRWHRVYLGPYTKRSAAEQAIDLLQNRFHLSAWLQQTSKP